MPHLLPSIVIFQPFAATVIDRNRVRPRGNATKLFAESADVPGMYVELWNRFFRTLQSPQNGQPAHLASKHGHFAEFVAQLSERDRVPLLLHAYDCYRELSGSCRATANDFEASCYSILISTILAKKPNPTEQQALLILRKSYHHCGHGTDVSPPLALAERAFRNRPYSPELFDAVAAYAETLRPVRSTVANNIKRQLNWVLWHDPRRVSRKCWTRCIQMALLGMDAEASLHWQWLLRNTAAGMNAAPGKSWSKEGGQCLSRIGQDEFLRQLDQWFSFPNTAVSLSPAGSSVVRLLIWYGSLIPAEHSLPILVRLAHVNWASREPAQKVVSALAWLLGTRGGPEYCSEVEILCREWATDSSEVARLEETRFPKAAAARKQQSRRMAAERLAQGQAQWEKVADLFGPVLDREGACSAGKVLLELRERLKNGAGS